MMSSEFTEKLTGGEGGRWIVTTLSSTYQFDLDAMTVTRIPGEGASRTVNDRTRPLREIVRCGVGARGYWLMNPEDDESAFVENYWQLSTTIQSIAPAPAE
jgi:hypothetical protein